ncbi:MAG: hypothetical protein WCJ06_02045 [Planctomycetota bacterium]
MSFLSKLGLRNWFKKTKQPAATRAHLNRPLSIESLENRITPVTNPLNLNPTAATISTQQGNGAGQVLHIVTTEFDDTLSISLANNILTVTFTPPTIPPAPVGTPRILTSTASFGTLDATGLIYTLNFGTAGTTDFGGILVEMLHGNDILNVNSLDFSSLTSGKLVPLTNNLQVEFYGDRISHVNNEEGGNILNLSGSIASSNDDIVYQQWQTIGGGTSTSIANISPVTLQAANQYSTNSTGNTGNYFHIFDYDQSGNGTQTPRVISITGSPAFLVSGNGPINIDTTINIAGDALFGYKTAGQRVDIISNAAQSNIQGGNYNINDNPAISFQGSNLYIATSGIVSVNGLNLASLNVYDTGDFTASRDLYNTTTNKLKPLAVPPNPSSNLFAPYDVRITGDLVFNSTTGSNLQAKFNGNVAVNGTINIYSYGTKTGGGSSISFGYSAIDHTDLFYLNVSNNFFADSSSILVPNQFQNFNFPLKYDPTNGIYNLNIYDDATTIGGRSSSVTGTAIFKNTGNLVIGSTDSVSNPTFTVYLSIDGTKLARPDTNSISSTKIFADITAGTDILLNGDLEVEAGSGSSSFSLREFQVTAGKSQLRPSDPKSGKGNLKIDGTIFLRTTSSAGSNLILSAGSDDTNSNNIPDGVTFGTVNYISIFGVQGLGRTLTINQCAGFKSTQSVVLGSIIINKKELNANSGSGTYLFQGNLGLSLVNSGVNFISGKGLYNIRFEGADNYFEGVSQFKAFGRVILGVLPSSVFHFENGVSFDASLMNSIVFAPIVCGTGFVTGTSGSAKLNGATLAPGNFLDTNGNFDSFGVLKFDIPLELNELFPSQSITTVKGTYYPEFVGNVPGTSQDAISTTNLKLDGQYILYPVFRAVDILPGTKFIVVNQASGLPIFNRFRGLTNQITNTYSTLNEGDTFYASGAKYTITYQGGDGNDVVITYLGFPINGPETIVYVDQNNLLNIFGKDGTSDVTVQNLIDSTGTLQTTAGDSTFGLTGFAYGIKAFNNLITIPIGDPNIIGKGEFQGIKVEQNAGNDKLNLINLSFQDIALLTPAPTGNVSLYVNKTVYNPNIDSVSFSFNGGPSAYPSKDIDILNLVGTNRNIETGANNSATVTVQGYDVIRSDNSTQVNDLYTNSLAIQGSLFSANQTISSLNILGNISIDKGTLVFGTINRSDITTKNTNELLITGINGPVRNLVPLTPGTVTFNGSVFLGDDVNLNFGDGKFSTNVQLQSISGTPGGLKSNITFNVLSNAQVYNGINLNTSIPQTYMVSNIFGGNIIVNGFMGTDLDSITITNAGSSNFYGSVDASNIIILKSDGNINFYSQVGSSTSPVSFEITQISSNFSLVFNDNLYAQSFVSKGQSTENNYSIKFLGSSTSFVNNTTLKNNGLIVLGDSNDSLSFNGGIQIESAGTQSSVSIFGKITSDGAVIKIEPQTITLTGDSSVQSNSLINSSAASLITLSKIQSNGFTLTLNSGNISGSVIKIAEIYGSNGKLIINSSGGVDIGKVGILPVQNNVGSTSDIFGSVIINDTIGDVVFSGPVLVNEIITTSNKYNVLFNGNSPANASYTTYVNSVPTYRWFYFVTGPNPTVFKNQGDVTFGVHGCDPQNDMDLFIFNGGVSTSSITGATNLGSRLYSVNTDINLGKTIMTESAFINTYFSSQVFNDLSGPTFLNPQIAQNSDVSSFPDFNGNEVINSNILNSFGFKSNQLTSIGALSPPVQAFPAPYGDLPYPDQTGDIVINSISNSAYYLHLNTGGLGVYGTTVGGNVQINTYTGGISDDQLGFYRGNNFTILNTLVANNLYIGTIANAEPVFTNGANYALSGFFPNPAIASPSLAGGIDLFGSVTIQSNFTISNNFIVTPDVNNLLIMGGNNSLIANNTISNSGVLQLGNSSSSIFTLSNNLNVEGPSVRRIGGKFNADPTKFLDFGPGPITLVADTVLTTSGIGKTILGQITNNQFNLTVNGTAELQRFADDFSLAPYPSLTNPASYIPTNNFVGAGFGGTQNKGNVTFNDGIQVQDNRFFKLNAPILVNSGFSSATGNGIAAIGYTRLPEVVVSGGGRGAIVNAVLGVPIAGFTGTVSGNTVIFQPQSIPTTRAVGSYSMFLGQPIDPYSPNPLAIPPNPQNLLVNSILNSFNAATGTIVVAAVNGQNYVSQFTLTNINSTSNLAGEGYTDLNNLYFVDIGQTTTATGIAVANPVVGGLVRLDLQYPGSGYTSIPSVSVLSTTSGIVSNGTTTGVGFYGTNGAAPLSAINNGVTPNIIINTSISPATIATGNVINIPTTTTLRKQGTGSVILNTDSSANTAGLVTTIENGNFFFENAKINAATVTNVAGNGLLGGTKGTLGAVNVLPKGQLSPGNLTNSIGVLNLQGNLSVQSTYKVDIRSVAFNLFDQVNVTGAVSLAKNNVNGILDVAFTPDASVTIGNAFGIISNDGTDTVTGNFVTVGGRALTQNSTFTVNMPDGVNVATFQISYTGNIAANGTASLTGGNDVVIQITNIQSISSTVAAKSQNPNKLFAVSTDSGGGPIVKISFSDGSGFSFFAYDTSFTGGVRTAIGDVNGDGNPDLITAAGPGGGPHVIIWTITPGVPYATVQSGFFAFEPGFTGGITLATGNINGDVSSSGKALDDIIVGAGAGGGPRVKAFAGNANFAAINNQSQLVDFFAYAPEFNLGVNVAAGDRTGDGKDEIITGAAQGGGPHVQVWQISNGSANSIQSFFAFDPTFLCGVFVGSGDLDGDGLADIYTGTGSGPIGSVAVYFGNGAVSRLEPFGSGFTGGVRVGAALGGSNSPPNVPYLLTAAGPGGGPQVSLFDSNLNIVDAFFAFQENFTGGVLASTTVNT